MGSKEWTFPGIVISLISFYLKQDYLSRYKTKYIDTSVSICNN